MLIGLIRWVRLRLRAALWRRWKTQRRRRAALLELGVRPRLASNTAGSGLGPGISHVPRPSLLGFLMPTSNLLVFLRLSTRTGINSRTAVYGPVRTVVWQRSVANRRPYADPLDVLRPIHNHGAHRYVHQHGEWFTVRSIYTDHGDRLIGKPRRVTAEGPTLRRCLAKGLCMGGAWSLARATWPWARSLTATRRIFCGPPDRAFGPPGFPLLPPGTPMLA